VVFFFFVLTGLRNMLVVDCHCGDRSPPKPGDGKDPEHFLTTQQISYGVGEKKGESSHQYADGQIVAAVGRSGARVERGLTGSGLTGEVLNTSSEPSTNSFVQRMWMYQDDSALYFRQNGVPEAEAAQGLSFPIGEREVDDAGGNKNQDASGTKKSKMRSSTDLMFNPIKNTGYKIFQDDEAGETANLQYHYKC